MKKKFFTMTISLLMHTIISVPQLPDLKGLTSSNKDVHVNVNVDNHDEYHVNMYFLEDLRSAAEKLGNAVQLHGSAAAQAAQEAAISSFALLKVLWRKNSYKITFTTIAGLYSALYYELLKLERYIQSSDRWCNWKTEADTTTLLGYKQQDLASMLLLEIQHRYTDNDNPTEFVRPLIDFMSSITREIEKIKLYKDCMQFLKRWRIEKLLWLDRTLPDKSIDLLQRVTYLKSTFLSWAAEYKINHGRALLKELE